MTVPPFDTPPRDPAEPPRAGPLSSEPVIVTNSVTGLVVAVLILLREFGVPLTEGQHLAVVGVAGALLLLVGTILAWRRVTPLVDPKDNDGRTLVPKRPTSGGTTYR